MRHAGLSIAGLVVLLTAALWTSPARAEDKLPERFSIEGVADPAVVMRRPGADLPGRLTQMVLQQAYTDALYNLSAYTRGIRFDIDFSGGRSGPPDVMKIFKKMEFQPFGTVLPQKKEFMLLKSQLTVGRIIYTGKALRRLNLCEGLADLPAYVVVAEYHNARIPVLKTSLHWLAAKECYLSAIMGHVAKTHGNRAILKATGRVYPVQFLEAELIRAPEPEPAPGEPPAEEAPAPAEPAAEPPPSAPPAGETTNEAPDASGTPSEGGGAEAVAPSEEPAEGAEEGAEKEPPEPWDSRQWIYRLQMAVRVQLDTVEFGEPDQPGETPPEKAPGTQAPGATPGPDNPSTPQVPLPAEDGGTSGGA